MRLSSIATNLFSLKESKYFPPSVLINQYFLLGAIDSALVMMLSKVEYIAATFIINDIFDSKDINKKLICNILFAKSGQKII